MPTATYGALLTRNLREARTRDHKTIHNLLQRQSTLFGVMVGREEANFQVSGSPEKWTVFSKGSGTTTRRNPKDPLTVTRDADAVKASVGLRIYVNPLPQVEWEEDLAEVDENAFASMKEMEIADQITDFINKIDDDLMAVPTSSMETIDDQSAPIHSLPTLLHPDVGALPSGFTTLMGVTPSTVPNSKWYPIKKYYGADPFDYDSGVVEKLCQALDAVKFDRIVIRGLSSGDAKFRETMTAECGIITGFNGKSLIRRYNARNNDQHGLELAKDGSTIRGIPLICVSELDNKNLDYRTTYTDRYPANQPAFFLPNFKDIHLIAHRKHWMRHIPKDMGARQYDVTVDILESWMGVRARRLDTSAVVAPQT